MPVITLSRQTGSGAAEIASRVAEQLGLRLVDRQVIYEAARAAGASLTGLQEAERGGAGLARSILATLGLMPPVPAVSSTRLRERSAGVAYVPDLASGQHGNVASGNLPVLPGSEPGVTYPELLRMIFEDLAQQGNALIVGRGGDVVLGSRPDVLRVLVIAPFPVRVQRIQAREGVTAQEAERRVKEADRNRAAFYQRYFSAHWPDPFREDLVINTQKIDTDLAAEVIVAASKCVATTTAIPTRASL